MGKRQEKRLANHRAKAKAQAVKPDPNEIITFRGWKMTRYTAAAISVLEEKLGFELTLLQGPFNPGAVSGSAGTHDLDGVIDLAPFRARKKCTVSRQNSWASWIRPVNWDGQGGSKHIHQALLKAKVASLAANQRDVAYPAHRNGLASNEVDHFKPHPELFPFNYNDWWHDALLDKRIRGINATINRLLDRLSAARARRKRLQDKKKQH